MNKIQEKFREEFITSFWDKLRFYFLRRKVRAAKLASIYEANLDKLFLETEYKNILSYDDTADRKMLAEENQKPLAEQKPEVIAELEDRITHAKAIQKSYRQNEAFRDELKHYLHMMDLWNQNEPQPSENN